MPRASIPPASALPAEAVARFTARANELTASGPLRFVVDPHGFRIGDTEIAAGQSQVVALAEALHALQVGQLVDRPGRHRARDRGVRRASPTPTPPEIRAAAAPARALVDARRRATSPSSRSRCAPPRRRGFSAST